ncbi:HNH endonuclease signature motif containing protein [Nocardioides sediminis]|uniref:HNH endonuclease signature motif containing protein n=1 Tax=Nocardioides sediminis TaxID=433648 RepID=UPI00131EDD28|nr:HNH endonuclease signature motif containing protein [Nocardioides sediminis]
MTSGHLVAEAGEAIAAALDKVEAVEMLYLSAAEKADALVQLARLESRMSSTRLRVVAAADQAGDVAEETGDRDIAAWCQRTTRMDRGAARREMVLARSLGRWTVLAQAHAAGEVSTVQADVIARALEALPKVIAAGILDEAERVLVEHAASFAPRELRVLGRRILDVVAPEVADDEERKRLEAEERAARRTTSLTTHSHGDGTTTIRIRVPDATADRLLTYLHAWTNPRKQDGTPGGAPGDSDARRELTYPVRLGHAFCDLLEHLDPTKLPVHGGTATTVVVTMPLETLLSGIGVATTDTGGRITASEARRLACTAHLVPAVLGGKSEVLDLGRGRRLYPAASRRAMSLRDGGCRAEGCDTPAAWCEAHHLVPWSRGGKTDLNDGVLLCSHHHHRAHDDRYLHDRLPNGDLRFHRRR